MSAALRRFRSRHEDRTVGWLLRSADPSIRYFTLVDVLGESEDTPGVRRARAEIIRGPKVRTLLSGQRPDGGFGVHPYKKWTGAHWRLVSLVDLGVPADERVRAAADHVLRWLGGAAHHSRSRRVNGLWRRCASQEGNALLVCSRLGMTDDPRVQGLAEDLVTWQWPDGGWNCDQRPAAHHSSFHESLIPLHGLIAYRTVSGNRSVGNAIDRAAEFFLRHGLFRSDRTGELIRSRRVDGHLRRAPHTNTSEFTVLRYPAYWHYNILSALGVLARINRLDDPRTQDALDVLEQKRQPDGSWNAQGCYWQSPSHGRMVDVVDWGRHGPNEMITLHALRVLVAAKRWSPDRAQW